MRVVDPLQLPATHAAAASAASAAVPLLAERRPRPRAARKPVVVADKPTSFLAVELAEHQALFERLKGLELLVSEAGERLAACLSAGGKLLICGNGGSAVEAQRMAAALAGMGGRQRRPLAALALGVDGVGISGHACRHGFDAVLARQVQALGRAGDALLLLHAAGPANNLVQAAQQARDAGLLVVGLLGPGAEGSAAELAAACHLGIPVPADSPVRVEEAQAFLGHVLSGLIERSLGLG
jgi:D-sedoheptulose 7-phosphate isomerase